MILAEADDGRAPHDWRLARHLLHHLHEYAAIISHRFILDLVDESIHRGGCWFCFLVGHSLTFLSVKVFSVNVFALTCLGVNAGACSDRDDIFWCAGKV